MKVTRETKQTKFRIPEEVLTYLKRAGGENFRSVNAELMAATGSAPWSRTAQG